MTNIHGFKSNNFMGAPSWEGLDRIGIGKADRLFIYGGRAIANIYIYIEKIK